MYDYILFALMFTLGFGCIMIAALMWLDLI